MQEGMCTNGSFSTQLQQACTSNSDTNTTILDSDSSYEVSLVKLGLVIPPPVTIIVLDDSCSAAFSWLWQVSSHDPDPGVGEGGDNLDGWEGSFGIVTSHGQQASTHADCNRPHQWDVKEGFQTDV